MARLGIDYGTTNTVVVWADRGRYPLVPHVTDTAAGRVVRDVFPSFFVHDLETGALRFGADAERCLGDPRAEQRCVPVRSFKRRLRDYADGARTAADAIAGGLDMHDAMRQFAGAVHDSVRRAGMLPADEPLEAVVTWPANANGAQRHITRRCFREAGFEIVGTLNEPSAAAIELADRLVHGDRPAARALRTTVAVFDLGGGTFDASLVQIAGTDYTVLGSAGIEHLGGDDADELLARVFAERLRLDFDGLSHFHRVRLLMVACREKERWSAGGLRSLTLDPEEIGLAGAAAKVPAAAFEKRVAELIEPAVEKLAEVVSSPEAAAAGIGPDTLETIYLVGGSSRLPPVARLVAARFPQARLVTTDKPFTATAMGAAIHGAEAVRVQEVLARHFGVIRLADHGRREYFAPIFHAGLRLPCRGQPPVTAEVRYTPRHNIGHLRYLECTSVDAGGRPEAGMRFWSSIRFPYDPTVPVTAAADAEPITPRPDLEGTEIIERYSCDSDGIITGRVTRCADGQSRTFEIFKP